MWNWRSGNTETSPVHELKVTAILFHDGKKVQTVDKVFGVQSSGGEEEESARTIDDTITDFLDNIRTVAKENGYTMTKETIGKTTVSLILFIVQRTEQTITIDIELEKERVNDNGVGEKSGA